MRNFLCGHGLHKFCLSELCGLWNSLPDAVVKAESVDRFWNDQEVKFNWKAGIKGSISRSYLV